MNKKLRIINAMFGRKKGSIEQSFIDYTNCLSDLKCDVTAMVYQNAPTIKSLTNQVEIKTLTNFGQWDPAASWKLKKMIKDIKPDIIITHGNRATGLLNNAVTEVPIASVYHNYNAKQISKDNNTIITVSDSLKRCMIKRGLKADNIFTVPNMVYFSIPPNKPAFSWREPIIIGAMGKLVTKNGFSVFIDALKILKANQISFKAIIAGEGNEANKLKEQAKSSGLADLIEFPGWIEDKEQFFKNIDIFCLPSLDEPFGGILLESFLNLVPIIATNTEGPSEIVSPHLDGQMVQSNDPQGLAEAIERYLRNPKFAQRMANAGFNKVVSKYSSQAIGERLYSILIKLTNKELANSSLITDDIEA